MSKIKKNINNSIELGDSFFKAIFHNSIQSKIIVENGIIIECNDHALNLLATSRENLIGRNINNYSTEFQPDGSVTKIKSKDIFKRVLRNQMDRFYWRISNSPKKIFDLEITLNYFKFGKRKFFIYSFFVVDNNKKFDFYISTIKNSYNYFIDFFTDAALIHKKGLFITCNSAAAQILDAEKPEDLNNINLFNFLLPEYLSKAIERLSIVEKGIDVPFAEYKIKTLKNKIKTVQLKSLSLKQVGQDETLMLVKEVLLDDSLLEKEKSKTRELESAVDQLKNVIIQKLDAQNELINSQKFINNIINSSLDIIIASDENGIITEFNKSAQQVFGYKREEVIGKQTALLYADNSEREKVNRALNETGFFAGEISNIRKNGDVFTSFLTLSEMVNENNSFIGRVGISRDISLEKVRQLKLIQSEERYRDIFENTSDLIFSIDIQGNFIYTNNSWINSLGYNQKDLITLNIKDIIHPESFNEFNLELNKLITTEKTITIEIPFVKKDRKLLLAQGNISLKINEDKSVNYIASLRNISEQKLAEEKIKLSEDRYRAVFSQEFIGIAILDVFGNIQQLNNTFYSVLGFTEKEMVGINIIEFTHPQDKENTINLNRQFLNLKENKVNQEKRLIHKNGSIVYGKESWSVVYDTKGNPDYFILLFEDITEKKLSQEKFLEQSAKLKAIFQSTSQSIITINQKFELTSFNDYFQKGFKSITGQNPQENNKILDFLILILGKEEVKAYIHFHQRALMGIPQQFEKCVTLPSGQNIWLDFYIDPIIIPDKPIEEASYIVHDITDKKISEEQIKQSLQEKEILLKEVHHRVKNNLQVISSILNLQSHYIKDPTALETLKEIQNRIKSMALIHENLYQNKDLSQLNFGDYIANLVQNLVYTYNSGKKVVDIQLELENVFLNLDYSIPCGLIINELISNSLKHAFVDDFNGIIKVIFKKSGEVVHLEIIDNGVGFDSAIDFRNTDSLGLQLVMALVDQINGTIEQDTGKEGTKYLVKFKYEK